MEEHASYILQLIRLGMLIADPNELDGLEDWHFGDPVVRDIVTELRERRKTANAKGKLKNGPKLLETFLVQQGCDEGMKSVEDAKSAVRDRVEVDGEFVKAIGMLDAIIKTHVEKRVWSSFEKRKFAKAVLDGTNPR